MWLETLTADEDGHRKGGLRRYVVDAAERQR
jgi:hypothetical protein